MLMSDKLTLTFDQREVYDFMRQFVKETGVCPTYAEICAGYVGGEKVIKKTRWPSGAHRIVKALITRGWIERPYRAQRAVKFL